MCECPAPYLTHLKILECFSSAKANGWEAQYKILLRFALLGTYSLSAAISLVACPPCQPLDWLLCKAMTPVSLCSATPERLLDSARRLCLLVLISMKHNPLETNGMHRLLTWFSNSEMHIRIYWEVSFLCPRPMVTNLFAISIPWFPF